MVPVGAQCGFVEALAEERVQPEPVKVNIDYIQVAKRNPFATDMEEPLEASRDVAPPPLDLSAYQLSQTGGSLVEYQEFVPREIDLSELTLDAVGAMMVSETIFCRWPLLRWISRVWIWHQRVVI